MKFLCQCGRKIATIKGDGSCLFRSFAFQLLGNQEEHFNVRSLIVRFENLNTTHFQSRLTGVNKPTISEHILNMGKPSCCGTHIEITAIASLYQVPVYYCTDPPHSEKGHRWEAVYPIAPASNLKYPLVVEDDPAFASFVARPTQFELLYYVGRHYDCIVDRETGLICSTAPALPSLSSSTIIDLTCQ